jgi:hypothetical protein
VLLDLIGRCGRGGADEVAGALAGPSVRRGCSGTRRRPAGREAGAAQPVDVLDEDLDEGGADLDGADAGRGLGVGDVEAGAVGVVEAQLPDPQVAQLADARARRSRGCRRWRGGRRTGDGVEVQAPQVVADGRAAES